MEFREEENQELNHIVLNSLKNRIYTIERENNKTKKLTNFQMSEKIRQMIERAVENDY